MIGKGRKSLGRSPKVITAVLFVSVFIGAFDTGVVVPALTAIIQEWSVPYQWGIWTVTLYLLIVAISMPVMGNLARQFGKQYILCISLALFGTGAALSGFAPSFSVLLSGRFLQGIGGGGMLILASVVLGRRGAIRHLGLIGVPVAAGAILAFLLGSLFVTALHWRWIFYLQMGATFCAAALIFHKPVKSAVVRRAFDLFGMGLLACIVLCLMVGFTSVKPDQFWQSLFGPAVFPFIVVALGFTIPFVMVERQHEAPLMPLHHFYRQQTVLVCLIGMFSGISWISLLFIPAFTENLLRLAAGTGGYILAALAVTAVLAMAITSLTITRFGAKLSIMIGFLLATCGFLLLGTVVNQLWTLILAVCMLGLGLGVTAGVSFKPFLYSEGGRQQVESMTEIVHYFRIIGVTVGAAVLVTFLTQATDKIPQRVRDSLVVTSPGAKEVSGGIFADLVTGSSQFMVPNAENLKAFIPDHIAVSTQELILRQIMRVMRETLAEGYQDLFLASAVFSLIGFVCAMTLFRMEQDEQRT